MTLEKWCRMKLKLLWSAVLPLIAALWLLPSAQAAARPSYFITVVPVEWAGSRADFERAAGEQAELFIRRANLQAYADVQVVLLDEGLAGVSLSDERGDLLEQVALFGLARQPADRYIGLTDGDLAPGGSSRVAGYTYFNSLVVLAEAQGESISAHELGHTFGLCDEYDYETWLRQDEYLGGCPNPFPPGCSPDRLCPGGMPPGGGDSIMGPARLPGPYAFNQPCYAHLQDVFAALFGQPGPGPNPEPQPSPTPVPPAVEPFWFTGPQLQRWDPQAGLQMLDPAASLQPDVSPDGRWLVYASAAQGDLDLYLQPAQPAGAAAPQRLTGPEGRQFSPRWLADSRSLLYVSDEGGEQQIWLLDLQSGERRPLAGGQDWPSPAAWPALSPDGSRLAFAAAPGGGPPQTGGGWDIYQVALDADRQPVSGTLQLLVGGPGADISPDWQPGTEALAFASTRLGSLDLYLLLPGGEVQALTGAASSEWAPRWQGAERLLFQASWGGELRLWALSLADGQAALLPAPAGAAWPAPAP